RGADRGIPRLLCTRCDGTFSARQGTAYFGVRAEEPNYTIAMRALAEGNSLRGTGRIVEIDKDTVCDWLDGAGRHCRARRPPDAGDQYAVRPSPQRHGPEAVHDEGLPPSHREPAGVSDRAGAPVQPDSLPAPGPERGPVWGGSGRRAIAHRRL